MPLGSVPPHSRLGRDPRPWRSIPAGAAEPRPLSLSLSLPGAERAEERASSAPQPPADLSCRIKVSAGGMRRRTRHGGAKPRGEGTGGDDDDTVICRAVCRPARRGGPVVTDRDFHSGEMLIPSPATPRQCPSLEREAPAWRVTPGRRRRWSVRRRPGPTCVFSSARSVSHGDNPTALPPPRVCAFSPRSSPCTFPAPAALPLPVREKHDSGHLRRRLSRTMASGRVDAGGDGRRPNATFDEKSRLIDRGGTTTDRPSHRWDGGRLSAF
ncbi:unnamed protein product [Lampetra planeri]